MPDPDLEFTHVAPCPRCGRSVAAGTEHRCRYEKPSCRSMPNIESGIELRKNLPKLDLACFPLFTLITKHKED